MEASSKPIKLKDTFTIPVGYALNPETSKETDRFAFRIASDYDPSTGQLVCMFVVEQQ